MVASRCRVRRRVICLQLSNWVRIGTKRLLRSSVSEGRQHPIDRFATDPTMAELFTSYRKTLPLSKRQYADMKWGPMAAFWQTKIVTEIAPQTFREVLQVATSIQNPKRRDRRESHAT